MKIIALYDKVAKRFVSTTLCETEEMFVRNALATICMDYPIKDVSCYVVGLFDSELGIIKPCVPRLVDWDCYKFPVSRMAKDKFLEISEIENMAKNKKLEFLQKTKDNVKDLENEKKRVSAILELEENKDKKDKKKIKDMRLYINQIDDEIKNLKELA